MGAETDVMFEGAAAGARSIFRGGGDGDEGADIFPKLHGLYWLLATLARDRPLALIVDDAQWSDPPSLHFLAFLARRTPELPVAALIATRPLPEAGDPLLARVATDAAAHLVRPRPLSRDGVRDLALEVLAPEPSPAFVTACHEAALGNPFLVTELLREVAARAVAPTEAGAQLVGELAPRGVAAMVMLRLDGLPASCRALIEAVAVLGDRVSTRDAASLADLTAAEAEDAATRLFRAGLLDHDGGLAFTHPVVRTAVEQSIAPVKRSGAHRRAAALLGERGASDEEIGRARARLRAGRQRRLGGAAPAGSGPGARTQRP
jgi:predicted ATPase